MAPVPSIIFALAVGLCIWRLGYIERKLRLEIQDLQNDMRFLGTGVERVYQKTMQRIAEVESAIKIKDIIDAQTMD